MSTKKCGELSILWRIVDINIINHRHAQSSSLMADHMVKTYTSGIIQPAANTPMSGIEKVVLTKAVLAKKRSAIFVFEVLELGRSPLIWSWAIPYLGPLVSECTINIYICVFIYLLHMLFCLHFIEIQLLLGPVHVPSFSAMGCSRSGTVQRPHATCQKHP